MNQYEKLLGKFLIVLSIIMISITFLTCTEKKIAETQSQTGLVDLHSTTLEYEIFGQREPLVILNGGPGLEYSYFFPGILDLAQDYQLVFYNQRGTGKSVGLLDSTTLTIDQFVEDLEGLRSHLGIENMHILGHSWGGVLAINYTFKYPGHVSSLILASTVGMDASSLAALWENLARRTTPLIGCIMDSLTSSEGFARGDSMAINAYLELAKLPYFTNPILSDSLLIHLGKYSSANFMLLYTGLIGQLADYDVSDRLSEIQCPTLFIHGVDDPLPIDMLEKMQRRITHSTFIRLPNCGHFPFTESPEATRQNILTFLKAH